jgi:nucleotide-binding universal stress UspA family protein
MQSILCPTDFSKNATHAVEYGAALAREFNARLMLVHVIMHSAVHNSMRGTAIKNADSDLQVDAEKKLNLLHKSISKKFGIANIETYVKTGLAAEKINELVHERAAELIVMGTTGSSRIQRMMMGSVASTVLSIAACPVLCIPTDAKYVPIHRIVFATDLHEDNLSAALSIITFAKHFDAEITFVFVDDKQVIHSEQAVTTMTKKIRSKIRYTKLSGFIASGNSVAKGLEAFIKKSKAQVLVMMTHEKHFPEHMFSQSLTRLVAHQVNIPLLAIKKEYKSLLRTA